MKHEESSLRRRHSVLVILWALLFAKCFLLEYWVSVYVVPINSVIYVWGLSLFMATAASLVYLNLTRQELGGSYVKSTATLIWPLCLSIVVLSVFGFYAMNLITLDRLPAAVALILTGGYGADYLQRREGIALYSVAGWLFAAGILFTVSSPLTLLCFSASLVVFTALPRFVLYLKLRKLKALT